MKKQLSILGFALVFAAPATFADFDASKSMICSVGDFNECTNAGCEAVVADEISAPSLLRIDGKRKTLESISGGLGQESKLDHVTVLDGKLVVQGAGASSDGGRRGGVGYTLTINASSGDLVLAAAGDDAAFTAFGACVND